MSITPAGGQFATARRGGMSPETKRSVYDMHKRGYGAQTIASITGVAMEDVRCWLSGEKLFCTKPEPREARPRGRQPRAFNAVELRILHDVKMGRRTVRGATREIGCSITAVRTWLAGGS